MSKIVQTPIPLYKGEDRIITLVWERPKGSPVDITGFTFAADVKDSVGGSTFFSLTSAGGEFVITDAENGTYEIHFSEANMDTIPAPIDLDVTFPFSLVVMDIKAFDLAAKPIKVLLTELQVFEEVTTSV